MKLNMMNAMFGTDIAPLQGFKICGGDGTCQSSALPCTGNDNATNNVQGN